MLAEVVQRWALFGSNWLEDRSLIRVVHDWLEGFRDCKQAKSLEKNGLATVRG